MMDFMQAGDSLSFFKSARLPAFDFTQTHKMHLSPSIAIA